MRVWRAEGQEAVVADLADPDGVDPEAAGVRAAVLHVPLSLGSPQGVGAVVASVGRLRAANLPVAVNVGTPVPPDGAPDPRNARSVASAVLDTGATVLTPTGYLENHAAPWALGPLTQGELVYPRPAHDPVAWIAAAGVEAGYSAMPPYPNPLLTIDASATWQSLGVEPTTARRWAQRVLAPLLASRTAG